MDPGYGCQRVKGRLLAPHQGFNSTGFEMSLAETRVGISRIALNGFGFAVLFVLFAANIYLLRDAINFELPEHGGPACYYSRKYLHVHLALLLYLAQLIPLTCFAIHLRSWFVFSLSVFPLWVIVYAAACSHN
jgi:hypothetical protein